MFPNNFHVVIPKGTNLSKWNIITRSMCQIINEGNCGNVVFVSQIVGTSNSSISITNANAGNIRFNGLNVKINVKGGIALQDLFFQYRTEATK